MEEIFEVITWSQLGIQAKPCAFLDVDGYYARLFQFLEHMSEQRFIKQEHFGALIRTTDADELLSRLRNHTPSTAEKWLDRKTNSG